MPGILCLYLAVVFTPDVAVAASNRNTLPLFANREEIVEHLEHDGFATAIELGVQRGEFASYNLARWPSCRQYNLVDVWQSQQNYTDGANVEQEEQEARYQEALRVTEPWKAVVAVHRMLTVDAVRNFADASIDFIYVDARHDYCGTKQDMQLYWPKLKPGGIMAGHDFLNQAQVSKYIKSDWSLCANGERHEGAVKAAVEEFAHNHKLRVYVTYWREDWPSWLLKKPLKHPSDQWHTLVLPREGNDTDLMSSQDLA